MTNLKGKNVKVVNGILYIRTLAKRIPGRQDKYVWVKQKRSYNSYMKRYYT